MRIPTPFQVGRVNCYLLEDDPLTLIDTGPNSGKASTSWSTSSPRLGHRIEDLELVIITHQHIDHLGLVDIVAKRSGAEVAAIDVGGPLHRELRRGRRARRRRRRRADAPPRDLRGRRHRAAPGVAQLPGLGREGRGDPPLRDGEALELRDRSLEVQHRPGHSPSDTVFWDAERRILIAADHLIKHISSNPLISRPSTARTSAPGAGRLPPVDEATRSCRPRSSSPATASRSPTTSR